MNLIGIGIGIGFCMGLAGLGIGIGQGMGLRGALEGVSKQPEAVGDIRNLMIVGMAVMETIGVLCFVIALMMIGKL